MMSDPDEMRSMIADVRAENDAHRANGASAGTLDAMHEETVRHEGAMGDMMGEMSMMMDGMSHCSGPGMEHMRGMHEGMTGEMTRHDAAMDAAADLPTARDEVGRHGQTMAGMLDGMDTAAGHMDCM